MAAGGEKTRLKTKYIGPVGLEKIKAVPGENRKKNGAILAMEGKKGQD